MKLILKAALAVASISSLNAGYFNLESIKSFATQFASAAGQKASSTHEYFTSDEFKQKVSYLAATANSNKLVVAGSVVALGCTYATYKWLRKPSKKELSKLELQKIAEKLNSVLPEQKVDGQQKRVLLTANQIVDNTVRELIITELSAKDIKDREPIINFLKTLPTDLLEEVRLYILHPQIILELTHFRSQLTPEQDQHLVELTKQYCDLKGF